jgi:hypothetical protein
VPFETEDQNQEPQERAFNIRFSRDSMLLAGALGALMLAVVVALFIPTGSDENTDGPVGQATLGTLVPTQPNPSGDEEPLIPTMSGNDGNGYPEPSGDGGNGYPEPSGDGSNGYPEPSDSGQQANSQPTGDPLEAGTPTASPTSEGDFTLDETNEPNATPTEASGYPAPGEAPTTDVVRVTNTVDASQPTEMPTETMMPSETPALLATDPPPPTQDIPREPTNTRAPTNTPTRTNTPAPTTPPIDIVRGSQTWMAANGPIVVTRDIAIPRGSTLTIEPGTEVRLGPGVSIFVDGTLNSAGRPDAPVVITSLTGQRWEGIFGNARSNITLDTTYISEGGSGGTVLTSDDAQILIRGSRFNNNGGTIYVNDSRFEMRDSEIAGNDMPFGSSLNLSYEFGNFVTMIGNRISGNRIDETAANVRIANTTPYDTLNLDIQGNYIVGGGGGNLLITTDGPIQGQLLCNTLRNDTIGLELRTETKQIPGFNLLVRNNFFDDHTPSIVPDYLRYGIGRAAASEVVLDMRENWWGDASGPYHPESNPQGRGEAVGTNIDYSNWLRTPPSCAPQP